ncbi:MAG: hypothetical protein HOZ81_24765 [Streptomyces sp.]|nr:hypothetical protein [Streptomyces sp.]
MSPSGTSPDARAVVRALDALTTQVKRLANHTANPSSLALTPPVADDRDTPTTPDDDPVSAACRIMETRTCPESYNGPCGDRPCARFESEDPTPWEGSAKPITTTVISNWLPMSEQQRRDKQELAGMVGEFIDAQEQQARADRRAELRSLLDTAMRGSHASSDEEARLVRHIETEIREADTARSVAAGNLRHVKTLVPELEQAQAAIERVRSVCADPNHSNMILTRNVLAALDGTEQQPEAPAHNFAAYQAAIARVVLVLRQAQEHREQTDPSERQDCVMCGADHFAEIRAAIKGKQPTTEAAPKLPRLGTTEGT